MGKDKVFIVIGDDTFQRQKLREILTEYKVNPENVEYFEANNSDWQGIKTSLRTYSLFGTPKFFVVLNSEIFKQEEDTKKLLNKCQELVLDNNLDKAYDCLLQILLSLELTEEDYNDLLNDVNQLKLYFEEYVENLDFVFQILKQHPLPKKLPTKTSIDFTSIIDEIPNGHYLIITSEKADKRTKNFKIFEKIAQVIEMPDKKLSDREIALQKEKLLENYIKDAKKTLSKEDYYYLKERALLSEQLSATLNKLSLLVFDKSVITKDDIEQAFDDDYVPDALKIADFIKKRDFLNIFKIVANNKNAKNDYIKLAALIKSLLKTAIKIKEQAQSQEFRDFKDFEVNFYRKHLDFKKQHPYYLFQCYQTFSNFSITTLLSAYTILFELEKSLKTTQKNPVDLFADFFTFLLSNPKN